MSSTSDCLKIWKTQIYILSTDIFERVDQMSVMSPGLNLRIESQNDVESFKQDYINRRRHVRIYYPEICQPIFLPDLVVNGRTCQVLDISEGGIRFSLPNAALIKDGPLSAKLRFTDNEVIIITGVVVRRDRNQIALMLEKGIPYCRILSEQLRLRNLESNGLISYVRQ